MANDDYYVKPYGRHFAVFERWEPLIAEEELTSPKADKLVAVCVYKVGAEEVKRRLSDRVQVRRVKVLCRNCREEFKKGPEATADEPNVPACASSQPD